MNESFQFDVKQYLESVCQQIQKAVDFSYPYGVIDDERTHTSLTEIQGIVRNFRATVKSLSTLQAQTNMLPLQKLEDQDLIK